MFIQMKFWYYKSAYSFVGYRWVYVKLLSQQYFTVPVRIWNFLPHIIRVQIFYLIITKRTWPVLTVSLVEKFNNHKHLEQLWLKMWTANVGPLVFLFHIFGHFQSASLLHGSWVTKRAAYMQCVMKVLYV